MSASITQAKNKALAGEGTEDSKITQGSLLLSFIIDKEFCIVHSFG